MTAINYYYSLIILYIMETNKRYELLRLNTLEQSDLVLYDLLREGRYATFLQRVKDGYGLTAFVLNTLLDNGYEDKVDEVLSVCKCWKDDVFDFLVIYWDKEKAEDYWAQHAKSVKISDKLSIEGLARNQCWSALLLKEAYDVLVEKAPWTFFEQHMQVRDKGPIFNHLVKAKRFDDIFRLEKHWDHGYYFYNTDMMSYLLEHNVEKFCKVSADFSREQLQKLSARLGFKNPDDLHQCLYDKGQIDFLRVETDFLRRHEIWAPYVEKKYWAMLANYKQYDLIDWENWMAKSKKEASIHAAMVQKWDLLVKHKAHWQLLKYFRLWRFVKSFF